MQNEQRMIEQNDITSEKSVRTSKGQVIKLAFLAWGFVIFGWCASRIFDRSDFAINNIHLSLDQIEWYALILFKIVPITMGVCGCFIFRKVNGIVVSILFATSVATFVLVG